MNDSTRDVLQGLLDMSLEHTRDIASLRAMNVIYEQVILQILLKTNVFEHLDPEAIRLISKSLESANEMIEFAGNRAAFDTLVEIINQKIGR